MRVYIASKYTDVSYTQRIFNTWKSIEAAYKLIKAGHEPFWPLQSHYIHEFDIMTNKHETIPYEDWIRLDLIWLSQCKAMIVYGDVVGSKGVAMEIEFAQRSEIPIFYSIEEFLDWTSKNNSG